MNVINIPYLSIFCSGLLTLVITPLALKLGKKFNIKDTFAERKENKKSMVRFGGIAILLGFLIPLIFRIAFANERVIYTYLNKIEIVTISIFFIYFVGLLDDIKGLKYSYRLISQFFIATICWINGVGIYPNNLILFNEIESTFLLKIICYLISIFWMVGLTNAINWLDGLDGLAAGITSISCIGMGVISYNFGNYEICYLAFSLSACCVGFLFYNFYPSKILMGDGGSYFLGFAMACLALLGLNNTTYDEKIIRLDLAILILLPTILDMVIVILTRLLKFRSPFLGDRNHLHYRIRDKGFSHRKSVLTIYSISLFFIGIALSIQRIEMGLFFIVISIILPLFLFIEKTIINKN